MPRPCLVIFTARSGSTALFGNLRAHPDIVMRAEVFGNKTLPGDAEQNDDNRLDFLRKYWGAYRDGKVPVDGRSRGFKYQVTHSGQQFTQPNRLVEVAKEFDPRIVILRRENALKQAISSFNARRLMLASAEFHQGRGSAHITAEQKVILAEIKKTKLTIDINALESTIASIAKSYAVLDKIAEQFESPYEITYEQYQADRDNIVKNVLGHIGVDPAKWIPSDAYLKITSDNLEDVVENYGELREFAKSNRLEAML